MLFRRIGLTYSVCTVKGSDVNLLVRAKVSHLRSTAVLVKLDAFKLLLIDLLIPAAFRYFDADKLDLPANQKSFKMSLHFPFDDLLHQF